MSVEKEQHHFETRKMIEKEPFSNPTVQSFFTKWAEVNDSIVPQIVNRDEYEKMKESGILQKRTEDNKQNLFIPEDLKLWEMIGVLEVVDTDTFVHKPEKQKEMKDKMLELGQTFCDAGVHIAKRLDAVSEGKNIAEALSQELYLYGQSLVRGEKLDAKEQPPDLSQQDLPPERQEHIDRFLAGDSLYASRYNRAKKQAETTGKPLEELLETQRQKTVRQFFKVAETAFDLKQRSEQDELLKPKERKPWQDNTPLHTAFLEKVHYGLEQKIDTPHQELERSFTRRGFEKLLEEMSMLPETGWRATVDALFKKIGVDFHLAEKKMREKLKTDEMKKKLEKVRKTGDVKRISSIEQILAFQIQDAVASFPYQEGTNDPSEMVATQYINCVGASLLGGAFMDEVGINYLVGSVPQHAINLLVTADKRVILLEMQAPSLNQELTNENIKGTKEDGTPLLVEDIVSFAQQDKKIGLDFDISDELKDDDKKERDFRTDGRKNFFTAFLPQYGHEIALLGNTSIALLFEGKQAEAIEARIRQLKLYPTATGYDLLGIWQKDLERKTEALKSFQKAIALNPEFSSPYKRIGNLLEKEGNIDSAIEAYSKAIELDPNDLLVHLYLPDLLLNKGEKQKALQLYKRLAQIAEEKKEEYWQQYALDKIKDIKSENQNTIPTKFETKDGSFYKE